jgi:hypothetical protein
MESSEGEEESDGDLTDTHGNGESDEELSIGSPPRNETKQRGSLQTQATRNTKNAVSGDGWIIYVMALNHWYILSSLII